MIYSIGDVADISELCWSSDWGSDEIFGEDYPQEFVVGLYYEPLDDSGKDIGYYIDLRDGTVIAIFIEDLETEEVEDIWNEGYLV